MKNSEIQEKVNHVLHENFEIEMSKLVGSATLFEDLGLDSLDAVDLLVHMEEKFGMKVQGERLASLRTLNDVYVMVEELKNTVEGQQQINS